MLERGANEIAKMAKTNGEKVFDKMSELFAGEFYRITDHHVRVTGHGSFFRRQHFHEPGYRGGSFGMNYFKASDRKAQFKGTFLGEVISGCEFAENQERAPLLHALVRSDVHVEIFQHGFAVGHREISVNAVNLEVIRIGGVDREE